MMQSKINITQTDIWQVVVNDDPSNITGCSNCTCPLTYAVQHKDGGTIRFYNGRTMDRPTALKLKQELETQEN